MHSVTILYTRLRVKNQNRRPVIVQPKSNLNATDIAYISQVLAPVSGMTATYGRIATFKLRHDESNDRMRFFLYQQFWFEY